MNKLVTASLPELRTGLCWLLSGIFNLLCFSVAYSQCSITINKVLVSGCYVVNGAGKSTVSVEVGWINPNSDSISVTLGTQVRTIKPGTFPVDYSYGGILAPGGNQTIVTPQVVAFEIDANGAPGTITAAFFSDANCSATASFTAPASCLPQVCQAGWLGGRVFNDYNADGVIQSGETNGVGGVTVTIYPCTGSPVVATTDIFGTWTTGASLAYPVRVEFTTIPAAYKGSTTLQGSNSRTSVQFVESGRCDVDLGISDPQDYCEDDPLIIVPTYIMGDPLAVGNSSDANALIGFPYSYGGAAPLPNTLTVSAKYIGTTWGQAYNRNARVLFSAATVKRHSGLGPGGIDAIYLTDISDPSNPSIPEYINLGSAPFNINVGSIASNSDRDLHGEKAFSSRDDQAFAAVGKIGIGGMNLSADGNTLYMMNLYDNSLYALDLTAYNADPSHNKSLITLKGGPYAVPSISCTGSQQRSWAVKFYKDHVYIGSVCDASISQSRSDLRAAVFVFDPATSTFNATPVLDFPLTYPKGFSNHELPNSTGWYPWTDDFNTFLALQSSFISYPTPILSDMEFDIDGSLILGLMDRTGMQTGFKNYSTDHNDHNLYSGQVGGDLLRAYAKNGVFVLENNGKAGPSIGYGANNNQGPGFGEFYNDNAGSVETGRLYHAENGLGALALRPGTGEVVAGVMDPTGSGTPHAFAPWSGGVRWMNNQTGLTNDAYAIYLTPFDNNLDGTFGKSTGLGGLDLACNLPHYLEVGNRVWIDTNKDGIQDACELALAGVNVSLYKGSTLIAATTTDAKGEYYFSSKSKIGSGSWSGTGADTALLPVTQYVILFGTGGQFANNALTVNGLSYGLTILNSSVTHANDLNDSDAQVITLAGNTAPGITFTTDDYGVVNHTLDMGVLCTQPQAGSDQTICAPSTTTTLIGFSPAGGTWSAAAGNPGTATVTNQGVVTGLTNDGVYRFVYTIMGGCTDTVSVTRTTGGPDCIVDLALKKSINKKIAQLGDTLTYTINVWNESGTTATGAEVTDSVATTVQVLAGSFVASRGTAGISGHVITWNIGTIEANGDTVTLTYQVKATQVGVHPNTAEISKTNEKDIDSTPKNGKDNEDDLDRQCFSVPFALCPTEKVQVSVPAKYTNVEWFKDGSPTAIAQGNSVLLSETGTYTFTAQNSTCPAGGCCPIIIVSGTNCCPDDLCIPFVIKKVK
ncbi:SdrD B-like domain-containing protein [Runella sp.]|uniref:SdrD B-like domain-containing protein n=1 Tax=Runella sp. TaxID=1960881 RepID=UPI003D0C2D1F